MLHSVSWIERTRKAGGYLCATVQAIVTADKLQHSCSTIVDGSFSWAVVSHCCGEPDLSMAREQVSLPGGDFGVSAMSATGDIGVSAMSSSGDIGVSTMLAGTCPAATPFCCRRNRWNDILSMLHEHDFDPVVAVQKMGGCTLDSNCRRLIQSS